MSKHPPTPLLFTLALLCGAVPSALLLTQGVDAPPPCDVAQAPQCPATIELPGAAIERVRAEPEVVAADLPTVAAAVSPEPTAPAIAADVFTWVDRLQAAVASGAHDDVLAPLRSSLAAALRETPDHLAWLRTRVDPAQASRQLQQELFAAVAASGTAAAERFLVARTREGDPGTGTLAIHALVAGRDLSTAAIDELLLLLDDQTVAPTVAATSLLALGQLAGNERHGALLPTLLEREVSYRQRGHAATWLTALANSRSPVVTDAAIRCTTAAATGERAAAAAALQAATEPLAVQALLRLAMFDREREVRASALGALVGRGAEAFAALERAALTDSDPDLRRLAIANLVDGNDPEAVRRVLTSVAHGDPCAEIRALAASLSTAP